MRLHHPKPSPPNPQSVETLSSAKLVPHARKARDHCVGNKKGWKAISQDLPSLCSHQSRLTNQQVDTLSDNNFHL